MKQLLEEYKSGDISLCEVPSPALRPGGVLVSTRASVISSGTELALMRQCRGGMLARLRRQPEVVGKIVRSTITRGLRQTWDGINDRLADLIAMGYSCSGQVIAVGDGVEDLKVSQRVACAGVGYATHGEVNFVPRNLCVAIPEDVSYEDAAFVAMGAIALNGVHRAEANLGEVVAVMGLGIVGQITARLLHAAGCTVVCTDLLDSRRRLARDFAISVPPEDFAPAVLRASGGQGADAIILTASTPSNDLIVAAAEATRMRGRLVIVGSVGMDLPRQPFYSREIDIRFSMSYGPGRYDPTYEEGGRDYPYSMVRWTEGRNMAAVLDLAARGKLILGELISHRFPIDRAAEAYDLLEGGGQDSLGIVIEYQRPERELLANKRVAMAKEACGCVDGAVRLGVIGAGQFARGTLLPAIRRCKQVSLLGVATASGRNAMVVGRRSGFEYCTCDYGEILRDGRINAVVIATRHSSHAAQVEEALRAGKHVFVEKPLALTIEEVRRIHLAHLSCPRLSLLVGHNRRFSRAAEEMRAFFAGRSSPMVVLYRVNAGCVPPDHWTRGEEGGGPWLGEGSHFVDFAAFLCMSDIVGVFAARTDGKGCGITEGWNITLAFSDGSSAAISYCDMGNSSMPKERCEVFADGKAAILDDFRRLELYGPGGKRILRLNEKGHARQMSAFFKHISEGGDLGVTPGEQFAAACATILCKQSAETGRRVPIDLDGLLAGRNPSSQTEAASCC